MKAEQSKKFAIAVKPSGRIQLSYFSYLIGKLDYVVGSKEHATLYDTFFQVKMAYDKIYDIMSKNNDIPYIIEI